MDLHQVPGILREVALTPAWQEFSNQVDRWVEDARLELEASENWDQFLETRGGLKALRQIANWKYELMESIQELKHRGDNGRD